MKPPRTNHKSVDEEQLDLSRARRVWQYFVVVIAGWVFFAVSFPILGYHQLLAHHVVALACFALVYVWFRGDDNTDRSRATQITYTYVGIHSIGIFINPILCPELASSLLALPFGTTIVFMLLGRRAAVPWLVVSLLAYHAFPAIVYGVEASLPPSPIFMDALLKSGSALVLFACLCQFELLYLRRTNDLIKLSHRLETLASTDTLTELPNRFQFNEKMARALKDASRKGSNLALLVLDMDGFKQINDTLGHTVGDEVLVKIAARLKRSLPSCATVARLGGDEFCVLMENVSDRKQAEEFGNQLHFALCEEYQLTNVSCHLGTSIGVAYYPDDAKTAEDLLAYADTAMYHAKENHLPVATYEAEQTDRVVEYCSMQKMLSTALQNDEFFIVYQPQIAIESDTVIGVEALLRWRHEGKIIPPSEFIPHLEASQRITEITAWILEQVCGQIMEWNAEGLQLRVAVNISAIDFHSPGFVDTVSAAITRTQIDASLLELEITEGVLIEDVSTVAEKMRRLKETGLKISIDDFGTGYSSLAYIHSLPIDKLKIDREFVKGIPDTDDGTIASTIVLLAKCLGFEVLAEGVETKEQLEFLRSANCDLFQGYFASRPVSPKMLRQFALKSNQLNGADRLSECLHE